MAKIVFKCRHSAKKTCLSYPSNMFLLKRFEEERWVTTFNSLDLFKIVLKQIIKPEVNFENK